MQAILIAVATWLGLTPFAVAQDAGPVRVTLQPPEAQELGAPVSIYGLGDTTSSARELAVLTPPLTIEARTLSVPVGTRLIATGEGLWSPQLVAEGEGSILELRAGGVLAVSILSEDRVRHQDPPEIPTAFRADAWHRNAGSDASESPVICRRAEPALPTWDCSVPPGSVDVRIQLPGFAPAFLWHQQIAAGGRTASTEVHLMRGASVHAWVDGPTSEAILMPAGHWRGASGERLRFVRRLQRVGTDGSLRFDHVPPGVYEMSVESAGMSPARTTFRIGLQDERVVLDDFVLRPPEPLEIQVSPAQDGFGQPWRIALSRVGGDRAEPVKKLELDLTGWGEVSGVTPGTYFLVVRDSSGSTWHMQKHAMGDGTPLFVEIEHVSVEGRLRAGSEPIEATLIFGTTQGLDQIRFEADEHGEFSGFLPHQGRWEVETADFASGCDTCGGTPGVVALPEVDVEVGPSGKAFVDIELPDTEVRGRVVRVSSDGTKPVPGAQVVAGSVSGPAPARRRRAQIWADDEGLFSMRGIEPSLLRLSALVADGESEPVDLNLQDGVDLPEIELRIVDHVPLRLRITSGGRPVAGALIRAFPGDAMSKRGSTDLDGRVTLEVPPSSTGTLTVEAPGLPAVVSSFAVPESPAQANALEVAAQGGDLFLGGFTAVPDPAWLVSSRGGALRLHAFRNFLADHVRTSEDGLTLANLQPGDYEICLGSSENCRRVTITPGDVFRLTRTELLGEPAP